MNKPWIDYCCRKAEKAWKWGLSSGVPGDYIVGDEEFLCRLGLFETSYFVFGYDHIIMQGVMRHTLRFAICEGSNNE